MHVELRRSLLRPGLAFSASLLVVGAAASAAVETDTVPSFWSGLVWSLSLATTEGFPDGPPRTGVGIALSALLMVTGFLLVALISASLASVFVQNDERPQVEDEHKAAAEVMTVLRDISVRLEALERRMADVSSPSARTPMRAPRGGPA